MHLPRAGPGWARTSATVGGLAWLLLLFVPPSNSHETALIEKILLLGTLVIVPLGLSTILTPDENGRHLLFYRVALIAQPFGAVASLVSLFLSPGLFAALLASLWFGVTALIGLCGLWRFLPRELRSVEQVCVNAGLIYLPVGGVWLLMARSGIQPLGFGATIVLLTAVHFHFAGFAAILAGLAGRTLPDSGRAGKAFGLAAACVVGGTPIVAAGITLSPVLALAGAVIISLGLAVLAVVVFVWVLPSLRSVPAQFLLVVSSVSSAFAMVLACVYAYSLVVMRPIIDIPQMALTHGILNSIGFALCGLLAWSIVNLDSRQHR